MLTEGPFTQLSVAGLQALWGVQRSNRCVEILFTVLSPGHLIDPVQAIPYRRLTGFVRMLQQRPDLRTRIGRVRQACQPQQKLGPVGLALEAFSQVGWLWVAGLRETEQQNTTNLDWRVCSNGVTVDLLTIPPKEWAHIVRESLRFKRWRKEIGRASCRERVLAGV